MIKDSGARREFESGALRDVVEGKGRCDLLPLDVIARIYSRFIGKDWIVNILTDINGFVETGSVECLERSVVDFIISSPHESKFPFGDVSFETMWLEVAKHFEEGCAKYGENNWRKGIPSHCYIDSGVRHLLKWLRGDTDEPHHRAFVWNMICCIWTCRNLPHLNEYVDPTKEEREPCDRADNAQRTGINLDWINTVGIERSMGNEDQSR